MKLLIATRKGLFTAARGAGGWELGKPSFLGAAVTAMLSDGEDVWAAVGHGHFGAKLHRSRDGGATFSEVATPKYPPRPAGTPDEKDQFGRTIASSLDMIWTLEAAGGVVWAGTLPGGLFRSRDKGESWELIRSLWDRPERKQWLGGGYDSPGIHSVCLDGKRVLIAASSGGVWASEDGGESWEVRGKGMYNAYLPPERKYDLVMQDPHRLSRCAADPDVMWIQHHNGAFRSVDGGRTFSELQVPPSSFGFAVAAHPRDPETAWFVPAIKDEQRVPVNGEMVVARTNDGGKSFEVLRAGLPQKDAYHLVYRHGLDVDQNGEVLAMGSTTGGLWVSETRGESWSELSRDLPPIYAVRFG